MRHGDVGLAVWLAPVVAQHPDLLRDCQVLLRIYRSELRGARDVAEVLAAMRIGVRAWDSADHEFLQDVVRDVVLKNSVSELGEAPIRELNDLGLLPPGLRRTVIPSIAVAEDYQ